MIVGVISTDGGGEFNNEDVDKRLKLYCVCHQKTLPNLQTTNGTAKPAILSVVKRVKSIFPSTQFPES
jgi:hypothetical protein